MLTALIAHHLSLITSSEPLDESSDALFDRRPRVVAEQAAGLRDVGEGLRHVAGLRGLTVNYRAASEFAFEQADQLPQFDRARLAEVDDLERSRLVIQRRAHARDDVINVCVVAPRRAVAEDGDGFAPADEARELVYGEVGALA